MTMTTTPSREPADSRSFDLTGVWDDFAQKEMTHLSDGVRILNQRMDDVTTLLDALKSSLRDKEAKEEEWRSGVGGKLLDFEQMLSDLNAAALTTSLSPQEGEDVDTAMTDGNLTRATTPGGNNSPHLLVVPTLLSQGSHTLVQMVNTLIQPLSHLP